MGPQPLRRDGTVTDVWYEAMADLLRRTQRGRGDHLTSSLNAAIRPLGAEATVYLVDQEQHAFRVLPEPGKPVPDPVPVHGTLAGRAFTAVKTVIGGGGQLWVPLVDGTDRLGVLHVRLSATPGPELIDRYQLLANLVGHLVMTKMPHGDRLLQVRRSRPMTMTSELLWRLLPPMTFACNDMVISAILEPCYEVGGDAFDYAVDDAVARLAILDATGHDVRAGITCALALAAIRATRRAEGDLAAMATAVDNALTEQFSDSRFATAVLAELDLRTGVLRYFNAGHPPPLVLRGSNVVRVLDQGRRMPLGIPDRTEIVEEILEPGDRLLLYTDGVTEARDASGTLFGADRLVDLAERHAAAGLPAPETLRRLSQDVRRHQYGPLHDDTTLLVLEWSPLAAESATP
jgi:sigma-B regulation protein RsbU (phosphoserine phosphatase)